MVGFPELFASQISVSQPPLLVCHLTAVLSAMSNRETQEAGVWAHACVRVTSYPELAQGFRLRVDSPNECYPVLPCPLFWVGSPTMESGSRMPLLTADGKPPGT